MKSTGEFHAIFSLKNKNETDWRVCSFETIVCRVAGVPGLDGNLIQILGNRIREKNWENRGKEEDHYVMSPWRSDDISSKQILR
ncbi:uncharacterized protein LOC144867359 isoform X2 [Branchiostoma floridae x Branchiostoma japonicum]